MTPRFPARTLTTTGLLLAVGLLLPIVFHSLFGAAGGRTFLPMHYAVLLGGLLLGPFAGAFLGIAAPLLSTLMMGMRAVAILPPMVVELAIYSLVAGFAHRRWPSRHRRADRGHPAPSRARTPRAVDCGSLTGSAPPHTFHNIHDASVMLKKN